MRSLSVSVHHFVTEEFLEHLQSTHNPENEVVLGQIKNGIFYEFEKECRKLAKITKFMDLLGMDYCIHDEVKDQMRWI